MHRADAETYVTTSLGDYADHFDTDEHMDYDYWSVTKKHAVK